MAQEHVDFIRNILPEELLQYSLGPKYNDFLSGVLLGGKNTMGLTQLRPAWVKKYKTYIRWEKFPDIDLADLSDDKKLAWLLLDPRFNIEAAAAKWQGLIQDIIGWGTKGELPDASAMQPILRAMMEAYHGERGYIDRYKLLANFKHFEGNKWLMALHHPMHSEWAYLSSSPEVQVLIICSGILDNKPAEFTGIDMPEDLGKIKGFLYSDDPYLRSAAQRTIKRLKNENPELFFETISGTKRLIQPHPDKLAKSLIETTGDITKGNLTKEGPSLVVQEELPAVTPKQLDLIAETFASAA